MFSDELTYRKYESEVGKYGRKGDYIFKITGIEMGFGDDSGHYPTHFITENSWGKTTCEDVDKIEEDLLDLIKVGDILKIEDSNDGQIAYVGLESETITLNYETIIEAIRDGEVKLLQIIPGGRVKEKGYILGG